MTSRRAIRAILLLLVFGLGGLGLPLAHDIDHLIDSAQHESADEYGYTSPEPTKLHDCSLCEVRITAASAEDPMAVRSAHVASYRLTPPELVPASSDCPFDTRAPPTRI